MHSKSIFLILAAYLACGSFGTAQDTEYAINTQKQGEHPPTPEESLSKIRVPDGFGVTLFAGEPDVHQPIAMDLDDRGRLWVAECYTYEGGEYDLDKRDRVLIFDDTNGDGVFDDRKVFWDQGQRVTGLTIGFGGVWITSAPHLLFLPDRDGDDRPDGEPEVKLEGFSVRARHNMVNGLRWGPDGWLYGRHGITDSSTVGTPETPLGARTRLNCSIWRYHPIEKQFEVVTHGTTNPWGLDYDDHGQWFFTNNVINHLWHVVPGAHYERMFGADFNPHVYELISPTADHFHWDTAGGEGDAGNSNRKQYDGRHDSHGGGHSHAGGMIYLGDNWPAKYRGMIFMCNTHGRRVNADTLHRQGNSYVARHAEDFLIAGNEWFRGVELKYGPDGGVYLSDWSDLGECHDRDGVHRTSGRIYKITYKTPDRRRVDLATENNRQLAKFQLHRNDWFVRHARRLLQERAAQGVDLSDAREELIEIYDRESDVTRKLRAMWALHSIGETNREWLVRAIDDQNEHVRAWAIRLLVEHGTPDSELAFQFTRLARSETSGLVRLTLASILQKMSAEDRWQLATQLAQQTTDANDRVQPLMIWYGIEPVVPSDPERALRFALTSKFPLLRRHVARRLTELIDDSPSVVASLVTQASTTDIGNAGGYLRGMVQALQGRRRVTPPKNWDTALAALQKHSDDEVASLTRELSVVFGDGRAIVELLAIAADPSADSASRLDALGVVIESQPPDLVKTLLKLRSDRVVGAKAIRGLSRYDDVRVPKELLRAYASARHDHRPAIIETLAARPDYAMALLDAVEQGKVDAATIPATAAAVIAGHGDAALTKKLESAWGVVSSTPKEQQQLISKYRSQLTPQRLGKANLQAGRRLFEKTCAGCHKMFGEGKALGPDLTGSNRDNLDYLLENIIAPSRIVPSGLRQSAALLHDGRVITGTILERNDKTIRIQTVSEPVIVSTDQIETVRQLNTSLMPDGLLNPLGDDQIRDLIGYLQTKQKVPLDKESGGQ